MMPWDWEWDAARSAAFVIERLQRGSIVCMHDGQAGRTSLLISAPDAGSQRRAALRMILDAMSDRGLRSVTISELLLSS